MIYPAFGIDLSDGALKAVKMVRRGTRMVVVDAYYRSYARAEDGAVRPRSGLPLRSDEALQAFLAEAKPGALDRVFVGLPAIATFNRLIQLPDVGAKNVAEMAHFEMDRSLRGNLEEYERRTCVLRQHSTAGSTPCMLFAVRRTLRNAFVHALQAHGLEIDNLVPSPAALAQFIIYDRPAKGARIALSIGLRGTDVVFLKDRGYAFRTIPLGVAGLNALAEDRRTAALDKLTERLAAEIGKATRFFFADGEFRAEYVMVFGEGATVPGMVESLRRRVPLPVDAVTQLHRIYLDSRLRPEAAARAAQMGNALGLALIAARAASADVDLLPPNQAREAARRLPGFAAACAVLFGICGFATWSDVSSAAAAQALVVKPSAALVHDLQTRAASARAGFTALRSSEGAAVELATRHETAGLLLARILSRLGPRASEYGDYDLRLLDLAYEAEGAAAGVKLTIGGPLGNPQIPTTLQQRIADVSGLVDVVVTELEDRRDTFLQRTQFAVTAKLGARGKGLP